MSDKKENNHVFVKWFSELTNKNVASAGGKGASLAEMYNHKFPVPPGFIVTAQSYQYLIEKSALADDMQKILSNLDIEDTEELNKASEKIQELIKNVQMPKELEDAILEAYDILDVNKPDNATRGGALAILKTSHEPPFVAVRSSATTEDLENASFAGQQETFLNVKGKKELLQKVKECFASLFTARAIYYRQKKGFDHSKSYLAVVVQRMIDSEKSGVMFSQNPVKEDNSIVIEAVWGLGEGIVSGRIKPDNYIISNNLENFNILETHVADKKIAIVRNSSGENEIVKLKEERSKQQVLTGYEVKRLAQYAKQLEEHYKKPQDIEFAIESNTIYIVQSRPITTKVSQRREGEISGEILLSGLGASPGIASGVVKVVDTMKDLPKIKQGDVLVTKMTNPDMVVTMQKASAIVTDEGGLTSHASIISREMAIPAVVGTGKATQKLKEGQVITVDGFTGKVFEGKAKTQLSEVKPILPTKTKIKVIVDLPDFAERAAKSGAKGVGLVRIEGIIASSGKHPIKYVKEGKIKDYIAVLVNGLRKIALPFEEIWVRTSDIRTDEFRNLEGSKKEVEGNPMLGNHGIRYSLKNPEIIKAELTALKELADEFPNKKFGIMVPQLMSLKELKQTKLLINEILMPKNVKIGIMIETPAAVQIINDLCKEGINFISFGTNDLTQYTLAIDRNNTEVQDLYEETNQAVLNSIAYVIRRCKKYNVETSICGQAGSKEDMVKFLLTEGIDSISVNADSAHKISELIAQLEKYKEQQPIEEKIEEQEIIVENIPQKKEYNIEQSPDYKEHQKIPLEQMNETEMAALRSLFSQAEERTQEQDQESNEEKNGTVPINQDIEEVILQELGEDIAENYEDEYEPGEANNSEKEEVPLLNDAIPVDSEHLENPEDQNIKPEEIDLTEEWEGETKPV